MFTGFGVACNDDFLEKLPETEIGTDNFFNTEEDLSIYANNFYSVFPGFGKYNADGATDNATTTGNTELKTMMTGTANSASITGGWNWGNLRSINLFLENIEGAQVSEEVKNHYEGIGRYFRAMFYMNMVLRYSDVPWYDVALGTADSELLYKGRDSREMVIDKVFEDYQFAAENVRTSSRTGEVNQWVVKTYMARHALYEGTYRKYHSELQLQETADKFIEIAKNMAMDVMDNGGFALFSTGEINNDYNSLFASTSLAGNPEIILHKVHKNDVLNSGFSQTVFGNYEVSPSKDLLQSYLMADGKYYSDQAGFEIKLFVEEFENRDPRLSQTYAYPGFELINTGTYTQGGGIYIQQLQKNFSGYHQIKGFVNETDITVSNSLDIPVLRYAEVLLTYAEAKAEMGQLTQADLDMTVNEIRFRVGMPALNMNPPVDPIQENRYPNIQGASSNWKELLEIRRERRVEMALEGLRHNDLMRWNAGKLLEAEPEGLYFPGLGKYDLTGDGIEDIILIPNSEAVPDGDDKESNELGEKLIYYRVGSQGEDASVYLKNGTSGTIQTVAERGIFEEPKYYYRPIPSTQVTINPNLTQIFGWD